MSWDIINKNIFAKERIFLREKNYAFVTFIVQLIKCGVDVHQSLKGHQQQKQHGATAEKRSTKTIMWNVVKTFALGMTCWKIIW